MCQPLPLAHDLGRNERRERGSPKLKIAIVAPTPGNMVKGETA
jgi:hypothetical protein